MRRWISAGLIAALLLTGGFSWRGWLPAVTNFSLQQNRGIPLKRLELLLLKYTDPVLRQVGRFLVPDFTKSLDENFLYFNKTEQEEGKETDGQGEAVKAVNLSALSGTYTQVDGTAVANATDFDVSDLLSQGISIPKFTKGKPAILIYHTHTTECYRNNQGLTNSTDERNNVVAVGEAMAKVFRDAGYETIHLTDIFNRDFNQSYATSRATVEKVLKENPTIQVVLDVHRDSISNEGVDYYPVTKVDGKEAAQVMLVCGTDAKGLPHPNWRRNFTYALVLSRKMGALYGELSRPVNLRRDRFNTHFTDYTLLLEVGSSANTVEQACYGGELTAQAMIALWQE